jgi:hypothetical protein
MRPRPLTLTALALLTPLAAAALRAADPPDFTKADLEKFGIKLVKPTKDKKTGFMVGGKNPTALIRRLTEIAGRTIADLEKDMRPGALSTRGFLGKDEKLLDVLVMDNKYVVDERGLTHQELARHLHLLGAVALKHGYDKETEIAYHGRRFRVWGLTSKGFQDSPFRDGTKSGSDVTVENVKTGKKLGYSLLVPYMIERYGFYEGKGTPYRVEPSQVLAVLDFLETARKPGRGQ